MIGSFAILVGLLAGASAGSESFEVRLSDPLHPEHPAASYPITRTTDAEGIAKFRGTLGDYRISVTAGGKQVDVENPTIVKDGKNRWVVTVK